MGNHPSYSGVAVLLPRIISTNTEPIADAEDRLLSYFIAHEAAHAMQSRAFGYLFGLGYPEWLNEGYADYVGKGGDFNFQRM
ncbi:MAG: peptidase superfamily domain protein [Rhodospirillales bacterium]|nr:peptidase superfamily domain protein [Rhodospirillales bacterium]